MSKEIIDEEKIILARKARFSRRNNKRSQIRKDLIEQLGEDANSSHFKELVEDYLFMWDTVQELKYDIKERGVNIFWKNSDTQYGYKRNDSVPELTRVSKQMLVLLKDLGIKADIEEVDDDEFSL